MSFEIIEIHKTPKQYRCVTNNEKREEFWIDEENQKLFIGTYPKNVDYIVEYCLEKGYELKTPQIKEELWQYYDCAIFITFEVENQEKIKKELKEKIYKYEIKRITPYMVNDAIKFFKELGYYNILEETELAFGPFVEESNESLIEIEKIAQKYKLYDIEKAQHDPDYHWNTLIPKCKRFFKEIGLNKYQLENICKKCYWYTIDNDGENMICGAIGKTPCTQYGCENFQLIERN